MRFIFCSVRFGIVILSRFFVSFEVVFFCVCLGLRGLALTACRGCGAGRVITIFILYAILCI